jgi:hypothetical protein
MVWPVVLKFTNEARILLPFVGGVKPKQSVVPPFSIWNMSTLRLSWIASWCSHVGSYLEGYMYYACQFFLSHKDITFRTFIYQLWTVTDTLTCHLASVIKDKHSLPVEKESNWWLSRRWRVPSEYWGSSPVVAEQLFPSVLIFNNWTIPNLQSIHCLLTN